MLINDTLSTIAAILIILESYEGNVNFNRIGSNPLEHLIGSFDQCYCMAESSNFGNFQARQHICFGIPPHQCCLVTIFPHWP